MHDDIGSVGQYLAHEVCRVVVLDTYICGATQAPPRRVNIKADDVTEPWVALKQRCGQ
jgi:uncharacterized UPF0146 family protein